MVYEVPPQGHAERLDHKFILDSNVYVSVASFVPSVYPGISEEAFDFFLVVSIVVKATMCLYMPLIYILDTLLLLQISSYANFCCW